MSTEYFQKGQEYFQTTFPVEKPLRRRKFIICCPQAHKFKELNIVSAGVYGSISWIALHETERFFRSSYFFRTSQLPGLKVFITKELNYLEL